MTLTNPLKAVLRFIDSICTPKWTSTNIKGCIAIHKPAGISIPKNVLKACFAKNKDGAGLAYVKDANKVYNDPAGAEGLADIPDGELEGVIESAEECPGECIFIEVE